MQLAGKCMQILNEYASSKVECVVPETGVNDRGWRLISDVYTTCIFYVQFAIMNIPPNIYIYKREIMNMREVLIDIYMRVKI